MEYYIIKNKATGLWDICTNNQSNPPLEKYIWAGDFKTEEEAKIYLSNTLKKIKEETSNPQQLIITPYKTGSNLLTKILGYIVGIFFILGIIYVANLFITPQSTLRGSPQLNGSWVTQFFATAGSLRGKYYSQCSGLNSEAQQEYYYAENYGINSGQVILTPIYLSIFYMDAVPDSTTYKLTNTSTYLYELQANYTNTYAEIMNTNYSYYGYYIYQTSGTFGETNHTITANTLHIFVELSPIC
jgi:hypothetical protein